MHDSLAYLIIIIWWVSGCVHVKSHVRYKLSYLATDPIRNYVRKSSVVYVEFNTNLFDHLSMGRWWQSFGVLAVNSGTITSCIGAQMLPNPYYGRSGLKPDIFAWSLRLSLLIQQWFTGGKLVFFFIMIAIFVFQRLRLSLLIHQWFPGGTLVFFLFYHDCYFRLSKPKIELAYPTMVSRG